MFEHQAGVSGWLSCVLLAALAVGCNPPPVVAGGNQTCATRDGRVRCWGFATYGVLGYGNANNIGDNETPASAGDVPLGASVKQLAAGYYHTCALLDSGDVRCWGRNNAGQLGYGNTMDVGLASSAGNVSLGGTATQITAGIYHTCALLTTGQVRCWGSSNFGQLGYGNVNAIGDNELPSSVAPVSLGETAQEIAAGGFHTCALLTSGRVRCWGANALGQLGYGNVNNIGDNELPSAVTPVDVGGATVVDLTAGEAHTCARLTGDTVRCWGSAASGQLGYGNTNNIGDNEPPSAAGDVPVGRKVLMISAGGSRTCALGNDYRVRCWGEGLWGGLGYASTATIGDNEPASAGGIVDLGGDVISISVGFSHSCAVLSFSDTYHVRCWGQGAGGMLGYGNTSNIGDNEVPASAGDVTVE